MRRFFALTAFVTLIGLSSAFAQTPLPSPVAPRLLLQAILTSASVSADQKAQIKTMMGEQRTAIEAAVASGDPMAMRAAMRPVLQQVMATLTPEQREAVRTAALERLKTLANSTTPQ